MSRFFGRHLLMAALLIFNFNTFAQWNYLGELTAQSAGVYQDLGINGNPITTSFDGDPMTFDNDNSAVQDIGFVFNFNGVGYSQFVLNSNGFIKLGAREPSSRNMYYIVAQGTITTPGSCITAPDSNLIYPMNHDLAAASSGDAPEYRVHVSGVPGSRICTIQFKNLADKIGQSISQFSNISFQIKLFEGSNEINFIYGTWIISSNPSNYISNAVGIKGNNAAQSINVSKSSMDVWWLSSFREGNYQSLPFNIRNSVMGFSSGRTFKFFSKKANDARIFSVNTYGKMAFPFAIPAPITVSVINYGLNEIVNMPVRLTVTGANPFMPQDQFVSIPSDDTVVLTFPLYYPMQPGMNNISVTLPPDDDTSNNREEFRQFTDSSEFCFAYVQGDSGVNRIIYHRVPEGNSQQFAVRYVTNQSALIDEVFAHFLYSGAIYRIGVWDKSASGKPGRLLYMSPDLYSIAGKNVHALPVALNVADTFFVGVRKPYTSGDLWLLAEQEIPGRPEIFFMSLLSFTDTGWYQNSGVKVGTKFAIGVSLKSSPDGLRILCPGGSTIFHSNISGNSYQWQVDTGTGFTDIMPGPYYTGINTSSLGLNNLPSGMYGYRYRCKVNSLFSNISTILFRAYWIGNISSAWENDRNWICGVVPDENTDVFIPAAAEVQINSPVSCRCIDIDPSAKLEVKTGQSLRVGHP